MWDPFNEKRFKNGYPRACQAYMIVFKEFSEKKIGNIFDSVSTPKLNQKSEFNADLNIKFMQVIPLCFKSVKNVAIQWIVMNKIERDEENTYQIVPDEFIKATAEYLGAT